VGTVTPPGADRVVTYNPGRRFAGTTSFTYTATDELGLTSTGTITVVVGKSAATIGTVVVTPKPLTRNQVPVVTVPVRTAGAPAAGRVNVALNGRRIGSGLLRANGRASIRLIKLAVGRRTLTVVYAGNAWTLKATKKVVVRVRR
jgi:hypothetical protein